jgi:V/A-type H+-transporting ATPase subunit E
MNMDSKISELTDKLYKEGVEKGEMQAGQILSEAKAKAAQLIADAKKDAEKITADAKLQAEELKRNVASEIRLSGQQAISAIKQQILDIITAKSVDSGVAKTLDDPNVMKDLISTMARNWKPGAGQDVSIEILLPEINRNELEKAFIADIQKQFTNQISISFSKTFSSGFRIGPSDGAYKISMTDQDFGEFIKGFLRAKARTFLFGN